MNKLREYLKGNLTIYMVVISLLAVAFLVGVSVYYPNAGALGDVLTVLGLLAIVVGGSLLHRKF